MINACISRNKKSPHMTGESWHKNPPFTFSITTHFDPESMISWERKKKNHRPSDPQKEEQKKEIKVQKTEGK